MTSPARALSGQALLAALRPEGNAFEKLVQPDPHRFDWEWMLARAAKHKVSALLAARTEQSRILTLLHPHVRSAMEAAKAGARESSRRSRRTLQVVSERFAQLGVPFLVIKGSVLAEHVYPDAGMRAFSDVDLVVPASRLAEAEEALRSMGYRLGQMRQLLGRKPEACELARAARLTAWFYRKFDYELPFAAPSGSDLLPVDLHWHVVPDSRSRVDANRLWERTEHVSIGEAVVATFDRELTLLHLILHATTGSFSAFRLLHATDVAWALARRPPQLDALFRLAGQWDVLPHVSRVLAAVAETFALAVSQQPLPPPPRSRRRMARCLTRHCLSDDEPPPLPKQLWAELRWGLAAGCLRGNLMRAAAVRLTRLRWRWSA